MKTNDSNFWGNSVFPKQPSEESTTDNSIRVVESDEDEVYFDPGPRFKAATMAMQALISTGNKSPQHVAKQAIEYADALIEELIKNEEG